jgi:capsular polysaccharide biosynthesis protein
MIFSSKKELSTTDEVKRSLPVNFKQEDIYLFEHELTKEIEGSYFYTLKAAVVVSDTVMKLPFLYYYPSETHLNGRFNEQQRKEYIQKITFPSKFYSKAIWITQNWTWMYFHWMIDALTRYVACKEYIKDHSILIPSKYKKFDYIQESLEFLGIPFIWYNENETTFVWDLILPSHTAIPGNYNEVYLRKLRTFFLSKLNTINTPYRKLFISRKNAQTRRIVNEDALVELFEKFGVEIHYFENYSFQEKISILSETTHLIGMHGAGLTNMLFLPSNARVLEIRVACDSHNNSYFAMSSALNLPYYYFSAAKVESVDDTNDVLIDVQSFKDLLISFVDEHSH